MERRLLSSVSRDPCPLNTSGFDDFLANGESYEEIKKRITGLECLENAGVDTDKLWKKIMKEDKAGNKDALYTAVLLLS